MELGSIEKAKVESRTRFRMVAISSKKGKKRAEKISGGRQKGR
jgi:hypothetical protein